MHVKGETQAVAPVHCTPPHCPHSATEPEPPPPPVGAEVAVVVVVLPPVPVEPVELKVEPGKD